MDVRLPETVDDLRLTSSAPDLARVLRRPEEVLKLLPLASWGSAPYLVDGAHLTDAYVLVLARDEDGVAHVELRHGALAPEESLDLFRAPVLLSTPPGDFAVEALLEALTAHRRQQRAAAGGARG
jgi:hypothetical protein